MPNSAIKFLLTIFLCLAPLALLAEQLTSEQAQAYLNIPTQDTHSGRFEQQKFFKVLSKPFVSSGVYQMSGSSFEWNTHKPVSSSLIFDGKTLWQSTSKGEKNQLPISGHYMNVLKAIVTGNLTTLSTMFRFTKSPDQHCILLTPTEKHISVIAETIGLCFSNQTLAIRLNEQNGNYTKISLMPEE